MVECMRCTSNPLATEIKIGPGKDGKMKVDGTQSVSLKSNQVRRRRKPLGTLHHGRHCLATHRASFLFSVELGG
jgi:hypothetical protein